MAIERFRGIEDLDLCEEITITIDPPKEIIQDCLPEGEDLVCLYTIDLSMPYDAGREYKNAIGVMREEIDPTDVNYEFDKVVKTGTNGIQQEVWLGKANGSNFNDYISGIGLLSYIAAMSGGTVASANPSTYLGDLAHFELNGFGGDDYIEGANNADVLRGGSGNDEVYGLDGDDNIEGNDGNDDLYGGRGNDIVTGGDGNDYIEGGSGHDGLSGGLGADVIYGDSGDDNLDGGAGNDELWGGTGEDWISGGSGNDTIEAGSNDDRVDGGDGADTINLGSGNDTALGGSGNDTIDGGLGDDDIDGGGGNDDLYGGVGDDSIEGGEGADEIWGGIGNDVLSGGSGNDTIEGGDGNDIIRGGLGDDELWGGDGCDVFVICDLEFNCNDTIEDFSAGREPDQIDLTYVDIGSVRVELTGSDNMVRLDLLGGVEGHQVLVNNDEADLRSVFERDTAYGTDDGALVKINEGVMVDLPSTSVLFADGDMFS